jgi:hypothetical protein
MGAEFTLERFAGHEGETFLVSAEPSGKPLELTLTSVTSWGAPDAAGTSSSFTLLFHGPSEPPLPQRIYPFEHPTLGAFEIFIVPLGPLEGRMQYEAVFS